LGGASLALASGETLFRATLAPLGKHQRIGGQRVIAARAEECKHDYMSTEQVNAAADTAGQIRAWCLGRLPDGWFTGEPEVTVDREEITVIGELPPVKADQEATAEAAGGEGDEAGQSEADARAAGRSRRFREETRETRIGIAREAEMRFGRKVSWGVLSEGRKVMFTTLSVPVMTRLRQAERRVLDTLVEAGVARSRSDALAWCVRLVGEHEDSWLSSLRDALRHVEQVRAEGPRS
jgi:hypothetical protein